MSNPEEELKQMVSEIIEIPADKITPDADFFNDLGVDSLKAIEIVAAFEKRFRITVPEQEIPKIRSLRQVIDFFNNAKK
jgi:acyl carrier protein